VSPSRAGSCSQARRTCRRPDRPLVLPQPVRPGRPARERARGDPRGRRL